MKRKYRINLTLTTGVWQTYGADNFIVVDSKLEIIIDGLVISYDFALIDGLTIWKDEDEEQEEEVNRIQDEEQEEEVNRIQDDIRRGF